MKNKRKNIRIAWWTAFAVLSMVFAGCSFGTTKNAANTAVAASNGSTNEKSEQSKDGNASKKATEEKTKKKAADTFDEKAVPDYTGDAYVAIHDNEPYFTKKQKKKTKSFEKYSQLDDIGRCGVAFANVCEDTMPTEDRGAIGSVKPTGWHTIKYDCVEGKYLYNRCHLIGYQLTGENANEENLITGTRALNIDGMLPFENMVADYVKETGNHVLYRVTPVFNEEDLLAQGVLMEAWSVEDKGDGICFNVFAYNEQPGVDINFKTGDSTQTEEVKVSNSKKTNTKESGSKLAEKKTTDKKTTKKETTTKKSTTNKKTYILNTNTKKFHNPGCGSVKLMSDANKEEFKGDRETLIDEGYDPCQNCNP